LVPIESAYTTSY